MTYIISSNEFKTKELKKINILSFFFGKGGTTKIKKSQLNDFLKALGVIVEEA